MFLDDTASVPVGSSVSVCDFGTLVVESRMTNGADRPVSLDFASAHVSCFYQARGEDSLGLLGFSGVWVSLRAL